MLIDTHAHLNFSAYKDDSSKVLQRSLDGGVWMINVGSQYSTSKRAVGMAEKYENGAYAAIGLHPIHIEMEVFDYEKYKELAKSSKTVAIGEVGLDYKPEYISFKEKQKVVLGQQLKLAEESGLPVIYHCRMAHRDLIEVLKSKVQKEQVPRKREPNSKIEGVIHCFTGTWQEAEEYLKMGLYLGFNGIIFKLNLDEIIKKTPLDRILLETDCPYLTPPPESGRNEPIFVKRVAEKIAKIKGLSYEEIADITTKNAKKLFKI